MALHRQVVGALLRELADGRTRRDPVFGLTTGLRSLDLRTGGLQPGELTVIAARPSHGKTALAGQIAYDAARHAVERYDPEDPPRVLYFSAEMPARRLAQREVARMTGISIPRQRSGDYSPEEWQAILDASEAIADLPIEIYDRAECDVERIREIARDRSRGLGVTLVVVDHLGIVTNRNLPAYQATSLAIRTLRELRDDIEAPVLVLSQLRRPQGGDENLRPELTDMRDSGKIEEDANNVLMIHNPQPQDETGEETRPAELLLRKARDGWTGMIPVRFHPERVAFFDRDAFTELELPE